MADRAEMEAFWERWLEANRLAEEKGDWGILADFYAQDATYGWNSGPKDSFMAMSREEIRDVALGLEMRGLDGWTYPYQFTMIDDRQGLILGFWKQVSSETRADGTNYVIEGLGGSLFGYADGAFTWQRDFYDHMNAGTIFLEMIGNGQLSQGMVERIENGMKGVREPGHYKPSELPEPLWPNEAGRI
ncbi:MAG: hypothetical protein JWO22_1024 [Frankiales bacterium]|nr:hypothetical protein [Frankiales bacterium]